jgi:hypothetical protein
MRGRQQLAVFTFLIAVSGQHLSGQDRFDTTPADGILDTQTGLIWGHSLVATSTYLIQLESPFDSGNAKNWPQAMATEVEYLVQRFDEDGEPILDAEGNPTFSVEIMPYAEFSWMQYGVAASDWRLPTQEEILATGPELFEVLDISPADGFQSVYEMVGTQIWTATEGGKKRGGFDSAYAYSPSEDTLSRVTISSTLNAIVVRGEFTGGSSDSDGSGGGGKGGGKGKKK